MRHDLINAFDKYHGSYFAETDDESLVFLATKTIEALLTKILQKHFLKARDGESLLDAKKPLEPFHAKISAACCLGLISEGLAAELRLLRLIRKEFRQKIACATLDYKEVREFCDNLKAPMQIRNRSLYAKEKFPDTPRGNFELTVTILSALLDDTLAQTEKVSGSPLH